MVTIKSASTPLHLRGSGKAKHRTGQAQIPTYALLLFPFPSWILFDEKNFEGDQHILSEGEFPTLTAMGCLASGVLGSLQKVPLVSTLVQFRATAEAGDAAGGVWAPSLSSLSARLLGLESSLPQNDPSFP